MSASIGIGWASRDITPQRTVMLRGQFNVRVATRVRDPLTLTALAIDGDGDAAILVSVDACGVEDCILDASRRALADRLPEFDPRKLIAFGTHTHTGPYQGGDDNWHEGDEILAALRARYPDYMTPAEYGTLLTGALVDAACEAWECRRAGKIGWGYSWAVLGENRRVRYFDERAVMYGKTNAPDFSHIEGHVDHGVNLLFTYDPDGALTGVAVNVACPSQASEGGQDYISADFWHDAREELRRRFGPGLYVLPQCSAAGDQSPHRLIQTRAEERMLRLKYGDGKPDWSDNSGLRLDLARRIADAVSDAEPAVRKELRETALLRHTPLTIDLQHWRVTEKEYRTLQQQIADASAHLEAMAGADILGSAYSSLKAHIVWCRQAVDRYHNPPDHVEAAANVLRLGEVAFVSVPFEFYLDFGDRIKGRSPALQTFIIQLAGSFSYLPTERAAAGCSYGAVPASCVVSPAGGQMLVDCAVASLTELFEDA
jgi:hypothetical protein